jgi:PKD repeat protein
MRNLLFLSMMFFGALAQAQNLKAIQQDPSVLGKNYVGDGVPYKNTRPMMWSPVHPPSGNANAKRAVSSVQIGVAGNLFTALNSGTKPLYADDSINSVLFIHRGHNPSNPNANPNRGQFTFDVSKDNGSTWSLNLGPLNPNAVYIGSPSGRFPQAAIFRPGNTLIADSAYLAYTGTWLNYTGGSGSNAEWTGEYRGVGRLDGDASTFRESADVVNGGFVGVSESFKMSANGVFWNLGLNLREEVDGTTGERYIYRDSLLIMKGVWNPSTRNVVWTTSKLKHPARIVDLQGSGTYNTLISDFDIAFSPDGQIGWIALKGDFLEDGKYTYDPVFYKSTDGGNTWSAPIFVNLTSLQQIKFDLNPDLSKVATTLNNADLTVDAFGNPHYATLALSAAVVDQGGDSLFYNYYPNGGIGLYDVTFDPNAGNGCQWKAIYISDVLSGVPGEPFLDEQGGNGIDLDNRINITRSKDGKKLFFTWLDTDVIQGINPDPNPNSNFFKNISPDLYGRGLDLQNNKLTPVKNFTAGDALWGGRTNNFGGGTFGGAMFPAVSPTTIETGTIFKIPVVLAEVDYNQTNFNRKYGVNPARFYYIQDIQFAANEFSISLTDNLPPIITLNGGDTTIVLLGTTYNEPGATAVDCVDGTITPVVSGNVDPNVAGTYQVTYIATDNSGNADTVVRTVIVGRTPVANFILKSEVQVGNGKRLTLEDKSTFNPTSWSWNFGPGASPLTSFARNPVVTYTTSGQKCIKLTVSNSFGTDDTTICFNVTVGIDEVVFEQLLNVYPNPSTGKIFVNLAGLENEQATITVFNQLGAAVLPAVTKVINGSDIISIDASTLPVGSYMVKVQAATATAIRHITIVK